MDDAELRRLSFLARSGDVAARNAIAAAHRHLLRRVAERLVRSGHRFRGSSVGLDDLEQEGAFGLIEAAARWDPAIGASFPVYAAHRIRLRIRWAMAASFRMGRREWAESDTDSPSRPDAAARIEDPRAATAIAAIDARDAVRTVLARLEASPRAVLARRYGLDGGTPSTCAELGSMLGMTRQGASVRTIQAEEAFRRWAGRGFQSGATR